MRMPENIVTLKMLLVEIVNRTLPNLSLREKEAAMAIREAITEDHKSLAGSQRNIKPTGVVRHVDDLGRIVIPMELRRVMGIGQQDSLEIYVDEGNQWIVIEKYQQECHFCNSKEDIHQYKGKFICEECLGDITVTL
jgi:Regulators of stationary/sporulation gene expression